MTPNTVPARANTVLYSRDVVLRWLNHKGVFRLEEPFYVWWHGPDAKLIIKFWVPYGLETDLASIPRIFRSFTPQVGHHVQPAVTHDYLYGPGTNEGLTRAQADRMMLDGMKSEGVWRGRRRVMYRAVRLFGGPLWG